METVRFLRDLEDEGAYAQGLELAYVQVRDQLTDIGNRMRAEIDALSLLDCHDPFGARLKELEHTVFVMGLVIRDCVDRRRRLAHVAAGLPDVVLDEETPKR